MERLTKRINVTNDIEDEIIVYTKGKYFDTTVGEMVRKDIKTVLKKLADYEDLEEKGLLLELPCKIGDTIWWLNGKLIMESEVASFTVDVDGVYFMYVEYHDKKTDKIYSYSLEVGNIGKTVFLTQEAAEQKLKEMENNNETN